VRPLRLRLSLGVAALATAATIAGFVAGASHDPRPAPAPADLPADPTASAAADLPAGEPLPPVRFEGAARPRVPAGILARAASARALERGPSCPPSPAARPSSEPPPCVSEQRESIDIDWHVAPEP
jgi:hypothetical protein